jgi:hypothetical protein
MNGNGVKCGKVWNYAHDFFEEGANGLKADGLDYAH